MYDMRSGIFGHLQRLPMTYFDRNPVADWVTRVTTDVDALNDLFAAGVVYHDQRSVLVGGHGRGAFLD